MAGVLASFLFFNSLAQFVCGLSRLFLFRQSSYLQARLKVVKGGKAGVLGSNVAVSVSADGHDVLVGTKVQFAKRYLKSLTKRYLKKTHLVDYVRVTAKRSNSYELSYFNVGSDSSSDAQE